MRREYNVEVIPCITNTTVTSDNSADHVTAPAGSHTSAYLWYMYQCAGQETAKAGKLV
jgi:hypothetical protein